MKVLHNIKDSILAVLIAIVLLILSGCQTVPKVAEVPEPPIITQPARPNLPINTPPDIVVKSTMDYILQLEAALKQAIAALNIYRKDAK